MASILESFQNLTITATSPDGNIRGKLAAGRRFSFALRPGAFERYRRGSAEFQAGQLISTLSAAVATGSRQILERNGVEVVDPAKLWDPRRRRLHAALSTVPVSAVSPSGAVRIEAVGDQITVTIGEAAWERMSEQTFTADLTAAGTRLRDARRRRGRELAEEHVGPDPAGSLNPYYRD